MARAARAGRLSTTPLNSAEAEYVAASIGATTTVRLRPTVCFSIITEWIPRPAVMFCDPCGSHAPQCRPPTTGNPHSTHPWRECPSPPRPSGESLPWAEGLQAVASN